MRWQTLALCVIIQIYGKAKVLAVEDDKNISRLIVYNLEKAGFECKAAISGEEALAAVDRRV